MKQLLVIVVLALNSAGLAGYLIWLACWKDRIFYSPEGVLMLLPVLPFVFVFAALLHARRRAGSGPDEEA